MLQVEWLGIEQRPSGARLLTSRLLTHSWIRSVVRTGDSIMFSDIANAGAPMDQWDALPRLTCHTFKPTSSSLALMRTVQPSFRPSRPHI